MKLNWGTSIAIFYTCFVIAMLSMVFKSCNNKSHLVQEAYYQKDLGYEDFRIKRANGKAVEKRIKADYNPNTALLNVSFPISMKSIKGNLKMYRPSNKYMDKTFPIQLDSINSMSIHLKDNFSKGLWKLQLDWINSSTSYYHELDIVI